MSEDRKLTADSSPLKRALFAVRDMRARLEAIERANTEPIAIVGMACRFPGAPSPDAYWHLLTNGVDAIRAVPRDRWDNDGVHDPDPNAFGKTYSSEGGFLDEVDTFDAAFFGISPREAVVMDPQQRLLLEVAWEALEHAAISPAGVRGVPVGMFAGISTIDYGGLMDTSRLAASNPYWGTGRAWCVAAGRVSHVLGLTGPTLALDTACSSSLVAVDLAVQHLRARKCEMALAGGVNLMLIPYLSIYLSNVGALSPTNRCRSFDARADGYVRGEGCGVVVLKRLSDAEADNNEILAVIRGSATNHDGHSSGLTVPNGLAQQDVLRRALQDASLPPSSVQFVEAHGTGTPLGDPIELRAMAAVFGEGRSRDQQLVVGSVKTNIGHLEAAAGIASLIKAVLCMQHRLIPPNLHFVTGNPHVEWADMPIKIPTSCLPWPSCDRPMTGVSSFGLSGTNAHLIVEGPPLPKPAEPFEDRSCHVLTISAGSETALHELAGRYERHMQSHADASPGNVGFSANIGRSHFEHRLAAVGESIPALGNGLESYGKGIQAADVLVGRVDLSGRRKKIAFLFSGQGAQYAGMGRLLYATSPTFKKALERCDEILRPHLDESLLSVLYSDAADQDSPLHQTAYTQPALFALEYGLSELWRSYGVTPAAVMGHSLGEYVAACVAGVFSLEDALTLVATRGRLMQRLPQTGRMAAVFAGEQVVEDAIAPFAETVSIAATNGPEHTVISGDRTDVDSVLESLRMRGIGAQALRVSHAFHSPLMAPILDELEQAVSAVRFSPSKLPIVSNLTGRVVEDGEISTPEYWRRQAREPVRFAASVRALRERGCDVLLELGPHGTLLGMAGACLEPDTTLSLASLQRGHDDWRTLATALAALYVHGVNVDWNGFDRDYPRRRVDLPTYAFQRKRYWLESSTAEVPAFPATDAGSRLHPLVGARFDSPSLQDTVFQRVVSLESAGYLGDHAVGGTAVVPASSFIDAAFVAAKEAFGRVPLQVEDLAFDGALAIPRDEPLLIQVILSAADDDSTTFRLFARHQDGSSGKWDQYATGRIRFSQPSVVCLAPDLPALRAACHEEIDVERFYRDFSAIGVELGANFRTIQQLYRGDDQALARVHLPHALESEAGRHPIHPGLLDSAFQSLAALASAKRGAAAGRGVFLPVSVPRLRVWEPLRDPVWSYARLREAEGRDDADLLVADLVWFDEQGRALLEIEGLLIRRARVETHEPAVASRTSDWLYHIEWQRNGIPWTATDSSGLPSTLIVFADSQGVAKRLLPLLEAQGHTCFEVHAGTSYRREARRFVVDPMQRGDFEQLMRDLPAGVSPGVLHFWSLDCRQEEVSASSLDKQMALSCGSVLHLVQALAGGNTGPAIPVHVVTRGAQPGGSSDVRNVSQASVWGLAKVIALENPELQIVRIDLDPAGDEGEADALLAVLKRHGRESEIALRGGVAHLPRLVAAGATRTAAPDPLFRPDASYVITGAHGGIGQRLTRWAADRGARHLVLVGRSEPNAESAETVSALRHNGVDIRLVAADVSDEEDVARLFSSLPPAAPLRGILHAAGTVDDGLLLRQDWSRFERVMAPKVRGAWLLHEHSRPHPLDFFVLFSTISAVLGAPGQGSYAAANAFMDALAHYRRREGLPALSINWGPWRDLGMTSRVAEVYRQRWAQAGIGLIDPDRGLDALEGALRQGNPQLAVVPIDWPVFGRVLERRASQLFTDVKNDARPAFVNLPRPAPTPLQSAFLARFLEAPTDERRQLATERLRELVRQVLDLEPSFPINDEQELSDIGLDSLMAARLFAEIGMSFGQNLPLSTLIEAPTLQKLGRVLAERQGLRKRRSTVVAIQPHGRKAPFFCVHGIGGEVIGFARLGRYLSSDRPLYGLQFEESREEAVPTLETMAARYVESMRSVAPTGPYLLGGYSSGGAVALEMAQQLQRAGHEVSLLVMLDSWALPGGRAKPSAFAAAVGIIRNIPLWIVDDMAHAGVRALVARVQARLRLLKWSLRSKVAPAVKGEAPDIRDVLGLWGYPDDRRAWLEAHFEALRKYEPRRYSGPIAVLRARTQPLFVAGSPGLGWEGVASGGLEIRRIRGSHGNLFEEPFVRMLGHELGACLDRADARRPAAVAIERAG